MYSSFGRLFIFVFSLVFGTTSTGYGQSSEAIITESLCLKSKDCSLSIDPWLKQKINFCEIEFKTLGCDQLASKNPALEGKIKSCKPQQLCQDNRSFIKNRHQACLKGYTQSLIDTGIAVKDLAITAAEWTQKTWDTFKNNVKAREEFLKNCNQSLACKKELVKEDHRYNTLSDDKLEKLSATFLYVQANDLKSYKASLARSSMGSSIQPRAPTNTNASPPLNSSALPEGLASLWEAAKVKVKEKYQEHQCLTPLAQAEFECYMIGAVVDPLMVVGYFGKGARVVDGVAKLGREEKLAASTLSSGKNIPPLKRTEFIDKYLHSSATTEQQNLAWMKLADKSPPGTKFLDVENAQMKHLNDTLKDKNTVTSLTNFHKEILLDQMDQLKRRNPGLEVEMYSDFKSMRFAFSGKVPQDLEEQLAKAFKETNKTYSDYLEANKIIRTEDGPKDWFRAGLGDSADQANISARFSRQSETNSLRGYQSPEVRQALTSAQQTAQKNLTGIRQEFANTKVIEGQTLNPDAFDIIRKNKGNPQQLEEELKNRFALQSLPKHSAKRLIEYVESVDQFSPGIHIAKREAANLNTADFGGLSADMIGLGALNMKGTAEALARSKNLDEVLTNTRSAERQVTEEFKRQKEFFVNALQDTIDPKILKSFCSGDDCVAIPTRALTMTEKERLTEALSKQGYAGKFRISFVNEGIKDPTTRTIVSTHGESLEKILRKNLSTQMEPQKLKGLTFGIDMKGTQANEGKVQLILGKDSNVNLSERERIQIQNELRNAIKKLNEDLKAKYQD